MAKKRPSTPLRLLKFRFKAMGTYCELQCYVKSKASGNYVAELVRAEIQRLERRYSRYLADSLLSEINRIAAVGGEIEVDEETAGLLNYADTCYQQSDGLFDITSGVMRRAWRFDRMELPNRQAIAALLDIVGWTKLKWCPPKLIFDREGMEIDFGGIVKEYAADRTVVLCRDAGVLSGFVNLGGDIRIIGAHPDGSPWIIGIQHPRLPGEVLQNIAMYSGGMACSGDYERCLIIDGERYSHIINPKSGWPVRYMASVSVISDFCVVAGSASTIGMLKEEQGPEWLKKLGLPHIWMNIHGEIGGWKESST